MSGREGASIEYDWYGDGGLPPNVNLGREVYIDTAYGFAPFHSEQETGLVMGDASGAYDRTSFVVGAEGTVTVGAYTVLNGTYLVCNKSIRIGNHCLIAWGSVLTDTWLDVDASVSLDARRRILLAAAADPLRRLLPVAEPQGVTLEDNVWVGFDAVVLPGVTLGRGAVVGSKTIVRESVPAYAVLVGDPARIVRYLEPDDTDEKRREALRERIL